MSFYKEILCVFIVLYISLSSSYFIKVQPRSKKQEVDLFIQKLLDSDKFDELADKIAMKAVHRINSYNNYYKEPHKKQRSETNLEETHRSGPNRERVQGSLINNSRDHTSEESKTTIISLKYKRFTKIIRDENVNYSSKNKSTNTVEGREEFTNKDKAMSSTETIAKIEDSDKSANKKETIGSLRNTAIGSSDSDYDKLITEKESTYTKKSTAQVKYDNDSDNEFVTKKETTDSPKITQILGYADNEDDFFNKFGAKGIKQVSPKKYEYDDYDNMNTANKEANKLNKKDIYDDDSSEEIVKSSKPEKGKRKNKKEQSNYNNKAGSFIASEDVEKHHQSEKDKESKKTEDKDRMSKKETKDNNVRRETDHRVTKDNGDANPEEAKEQDNSDSREGKSSNNTILVRREGNTLYAQNLGDYEDYRTLLEKADAGSGMKDVAPL